MDAELNAFYDRMLVDIASQACRLREKEVCVFRNQAGTVYDGRLMVIGSAVNGWTNVSAPANRIVKVK